MEAERNIEIKAKVGSDEEFERRIKIAEKLTNKKGEIIHQRDVFFNSKEGRLKLRYLEPPSRSQLVFYNRPDKPGPKLSQFHKIEVDDPEILEKILISSNGAQGYLIKKRILFIYEQTRIHLDQVEGLGNFLEFEVCLTPEQSLDAGEEIVQKLMQIFLIKKEDLMSGAYFDEIRTTNQ